MPIGVWTSTRRDAPALTLKANPQINRLLLALRREQSYSIASR